jgi:ABC-type spermidine/putrescine transport system permease subunit I
MQRVHSWVTYLQVAPLALVFLLFLVVPIATIVVVSFFDYNTTQIIPAFLIQNYEELLFSPVTWQTYLQTVEFAAITWVLTLAIGFAVAYFLAFHVRSTTWQMVLFLVCFITVRLMSGGQSASVGLMMLNAMSLLQYPAAAANAVVLLLLVLFTVAAMMRLVDIRKEL